MEAEGQEVERIYGYEDNCVITIGEYCEEENVWDCENVSYLEFYNDLDLGCMYWSRDNFEQCFAYFRTEDQETPTWEFLSDGGNAWIWTECGPNWK